MWWHGGAGLTERSERGSLSAVATHDVFGSTVFASACIQDESQSYEHGEMGRIHRNAMNVAEIPELFGNLRVAAMTSDIEFVVLLIPIQGTPAKIDVHSPACCKIHNAHDNNHA